MCLIKSVLNNLPIYYLSIPVLVTVAAKIAKKIRSKNASYIHGVEWLMHVQGIMRT